MKKNIRFISHALIKTDNQYLVIKRTSIKRGKPNMYPEYWDIPGGMVEINENIKDAAIRETLEETNLNIKLLNIIHKDSTFDKEKNTTFIRYIFNAQLLDGESINNIRLQEDEHTEFKLIKDIDEVDKVVDYLKTLIN